jgi:hypothetical protein
MSTPKIRKTFPDLRKAMQKFGINLTYAQIAAYARKYPSIKNDVLRYDCTDTYVRDYLIYAVVASVLGKDYDWPGNGKDPEWTNLFYEKFFLTAHEKGIRVQPYVLKLAKDGTFRKRAEAYREQTRFK